MHASRQGVSPALDALRRRRRHEAPLLARMRRTTAPRVLALCVALAGLPLVGVPPAALAALLRAAAPGDETGERWLGPGALDPQEDCERSADCASVCGGAWGVAPPCLAVTRGPPSARASLSPADGYGATVSLAPRSNRARAPPA